MGTIGPYGGGNVESSAPMIAVVPITPFLIAVMIGWVFSVCVHEFAHAATAYRGGDRSVRQRGYLSFNPLMYVDPITSILLPCVFLVMGGVPLPGGSVRINRAALRSRAWESAVAAAGPLANGLLFVLIAVLLHPATGLVDASAADPPMWARLLGVLAVLQVFAVILNLVPVPPFDGFGIIEPYLDADTRARLADPQFRWIGIALVIFVLFRGDWVYGWIDAVLLRSGLSHDRTWKYFNILFTGGSG